MFISKKKRKRRKGGKKEKNNDHFEGKVLRKRINLPSCAVVIS
jgi:hypothetical protein